MTAKKLLLAFAIVFAAAAIGYWRLTATPSRGDATPRDDMSVEPKPDNPSKPISEEDKIRQRLLGVWQDEYKGKRTLTLNDDGTGTMLVELSGLQAVLFAAKLKFDMRWSLDGKTLTKKTLSGEPADKVNLILNTMGNTAADTLLELTDDRLLLLDKDGTTKYDWKRIKKDESGK